MPTLCDTRVQVCQTNYYRKPMGSDSNTAYLRNTPYELIVSQARSRGSVSNG